MRTKKNALYYIILLILGYFIYRFQIEKSFNLLTIYILAVSFSFFSFLFKIDSRKTLPVLFVCSLFAMYGMRNQYGEYQQLLPSFVLLLSLMTLMLVTLLGNYNLRLKKLFLILLAIPLACIYILDVSGLEEFKYIPFVIGSFFMFRSISFLHEIKFLKKEVPLLDKVNYFLLSPNFSMPIFPIVDYKSFISSYEGVCTNTLKRGSALICRGLFQMLLYRFIYHEIIIPFDQIQTAAEVLTFIVANYMIILRVIGAYHMAIGIVIISGYNIPDIFNNIFFATSFGDLWRRINIYWLNFMLKIFYYPIYFKLKKIGVYKALFISTFLCFIITWFLHSYQWFWVKGFFPLEIKDAIFWLGFGLLVSLNTLWQQKKLEEGNKNKTTYLPIKNALSGLIILLVMSALWSIWTSNSMEYWWQMMSNFKNIDAHQIEIILIGVLVYLIVTSVYHYFQVHKERGLKFLSNRINTFSIPIFVLLCTSLFAFNLMVVKPSMYHEIILYSITRERLNKSDQMINDNGYYSNLISTNEYCTQVWVNDFDVTQRWTRHVTLKTTSISPDLFLKRGIPYASVKFKDITYSLNSIGLRDKEYPKIKPDSCYRMIILGGSYECGNGITDGEDYISLVEKDLNEKYIPSIDGRPVHVELINFSINGYRLIQRLYQYKTFARDWNPDAFLLFIHTDYQNRITNYVYSLVLFGYPIADQYVNDIVKSTNISKFDNRLQVRKKVGAYADSINYYAVREMVKIANDDGTKPVCVYLPTTKKRGSKKDRTFMQNICTENNLQAIYLTDVFDGYDFEDLKISDVDEHPSKEANDLIYKKLLENIINHGDYFNIKFTKK